MKKEKIAWILFGVPGAGKSTWANTNCPSAVIISRDIVRENLGLVAPGKKGVGSREQEMEVTGVVQEELSQAVTSEKEIVLDNTNLNPRFLEPDLSFLRDHGYKIKGVVFKTPLSVCISRRSEQIPLPVMTRMQENFEKLDIPGLGISDILEIK